MCGVGRIVANGGGDAGRNDVIELGQTRAAARQSDSLDVAVLGPK